MNTTSPELDLEQLRRIAEQGIDHDDGYDYLVRAADLAALRVGVPALIDRLERAEAALARLTSFATAEAVIDDIISGPTNANAAKAIQAVLNRIAAKEQNR